MVYPCVKRLFDLLAAGALLLLLLPLLLPLMLLLRLTAEGEVFYFQRRIGRNGEPFYIWKFATMLKDSPNMGAGTITLRNDPRVTPVGRFLRKTKINELPQLVNVLRGDMSFVGPRPLVERAFRAYLPEVQARIGLVRPGITGVGAIVFRDEEKWISRSDMAPSAFYDKHIAPYKGELEMWYLDRRSFRLDLLLFMITIWVVFHPRSEAVFRVFSSLPQRPDFLTAKATKDREGTL